MKKTAFILFFFTFIFVSLFLLEPSQPSEVEAAGDGLVNPPPLTLPTIGLYTNEQARYGRIATNYQAIYGPDSCTHLGDPFSPLNANWAPGPYTYTYAIRIPADYPHDILRVELFDPDSINTTQNSLTILRSNTAINNGLGAVASKTCGIDGGSSSQTDPCALETDELGVVSSTVDQEQINPYWFVRADANRTPPTSPGGLCGTPGSYTPSLNTETLYSL